MPVTRSLFALPALAALVWCATRGMGAEVSGPVHQVLTNRSATLMLDYFKSLAARLPPTEQTCASRQAWETRRVELRRKLWDSLGDFPLDNRPPLRPRITGRLDHVDHVVEKVVYESLPGLYVTGLMYLPKNRQGRVPAVIYCNVHWSGAKAEPVIQNCCL